jgi:hypothetical protein
LSSAIGDRLLVDIQDLIWPADILVGNINANDPTLLQVDDTDDRSAVDNLNQVGLGGIAGPSGHDTTIGPESSRGLDFAFSLATKFSSQATLRVRDQGALGSTVWNRADSAG